MREFKLVLLVLAMVLGSVTFAAGANQVKGNASVQHSHKSSWFKGSKNTLTQGTVMLSPRSDKARQLNARTIKKPTPPRVNK